MKIDASTSHSSMATAKNHDSPKTLEAGSISGPILETLIFTEILERLRKPIGEGGVLCFAETLLPIAKNVSAIPVGLV